MKYLMSINGFLGKVEEFILSWSIIFMAVLLCGNTVARTVFNHSWGFVEEMGQFLMIVLTFIGASNAARLGRHVCMTAIFDAMPFKIKKLFIYLISLVTCACLLYLTYFSYDYVAKVFASGRITPSLQVPIWIVFGFVPLGLFMTALQYLINFILNVIDRKVLYMGSEKVASEEEGAGSVSII